ncbi:glutamyl-tRNA reductase, partial [Bacillus xiapuensis]|nr:glutamyl-tRNA reductase [Bacillus xiapuensis]
VVDKTHTAKQKIIRFLNDSFGTHKLQITNNLYFKKNDEAVKHLFRVICGLDSMVLGETQILGQVKEAYIRSHRHQATDTIFNKLFKQAITFAKHVHSETDIGRNAVSVSYAAIELGKKILGPLHSKTAVILGAGEMAELTVKHLHANGADKIIVVNRTYERAMKLAEKFSATAKTMDQIYDVLIDADIVISSIDIKKPIITVEDLETIYLKRNQRPLFIIDISVPRNIDPNINNLDNIFLYDIDDLEGIVETNLEKRAQEREKINYLIEQELLNYQTWLSTLGITPVMAALRLKSFTIYEEALNQIENKLPDLTERERKIIRKYSKSIVTQMLHSPLIGMKQMVTTNSNQKEILDLIIQLFSLEEEIDKQHKSRKCNSKPNLDLFNVLHPSTTFGNIPVHS